MRTPLKLAAYGGVLAAAFAGALGAGSVLGGPVPAVSDMHTAGEAHIEPSGTPASQGESFTPGSSELSGTKDLPGGLMVSDRGYTLAPDSTTLSAGTQMPLTFRILDADGEPITTFEQSHDKQMHLIAVRSDTTGFQHVHPTVSDEGTWSVPLDLTAGTWRIFTDFVPAQGDAKGDSLTLGADISVAGDYVPAALPAVSRTAEIDGYTVTVEGELIPGEESELTLSVARDGEPVTDLEPYLAAYGHLVALRAGDLAYLHVHPAGTPGDGQTEAGPGITFYAKVPSVGGYRLYLDFQHDGVVRTADFTATADYSQDPGDATSNEGTVPGAGDNHSDH